MNRLDLSTLKGAVSLAAAPRDLRPRQPLRVALVTSSYTYIADGVALTLNRLVGYLLARGVEVLVFTPVVARPALVCLGNIVPVPSMALPLRSEYRLSFGLGGGGARRLEAFEPDIIHVAAPDILGHDALALGRRLGCPVVASYHTRYETYLKFYGLDRLKGLLARRIGHFYGACREVYAPSPSMVDELVAQGAGDNVRLWERGVDTERFNPAKRRSSWREARGIGAGEIVVTFVGRLVREKRLETLIATLSRLREARIGVRPLIVGDGPEASMLKSALPEALYTGFLTGDHLADAYANSDVFLFPSDTETFGNVTLEAMASGLPTVCADATGSRSLVDPGVTGFLADSADSAAFFHRVSELVEDVTLQRRMGAAARARSLLFSWDEAMAGILSRYETLAAAA